MKKLHYVTKSLVIILLLTSLSACSIFTGVKNWSDKMGSYLPVYDESKRCDNMLCFDKKSAKKRQQQQYQQPQYQSQNGAYPTNNIQRRPANPDSRARQYQAPPKYGNSPKTYAPKEYAPSSARMEVPKRPPQRSQPRDYPMRTVTHNGMMIPDVDLGGDKNQIPKQLTDADFGDPMYSDPDGFPMLPYPSAKKRDDTNPITGIPEWKRNLPKNPYIDKINELERKTGW